MYDVYLIISNIHEQISLLYLIIFVHQLPLIMYYKTLFLIVIIKTIAYTQTQTRCYRLYTRDFDFFLIHEKICNHVYEYLLTFAKPNLIKNNAVHTYLKQLKKILFMKSFVII